MEREMKVEATENPAPDSGAARRKWRPRVVRSIAATAGSDAASIKTGTEGREPLISVWWDDPPCGNP